MGQRQNVIPFNIPYTPDISKKYVQEVLNSQHQQGDGPFTAKASKIISQLVGGGHTLLTPSCTHALEMASMLANLGPGDEVILPSYTFTSAAIAITKFGATPVFADIEKDTKGINVDHARKLITPRTKAISWVNYAGVPPDLEGLKQLRNEFGLLLIEDNAHSLGGSYNKLPLGSFGDFATQSFHATKNVQCGEGGALIINNSKLVERAEVIREKGTNRRKFMQGEVQKYQWVDQGSSYLLAESLAAQLLGQLEKFTQIQDSRNKTFEKYRTSLMEWSISSGVELQFVRNMDSHTAHMFYMVMESQEKRNRMIQHLETFKVKSTFHYQSLATSTRGNRYNNGGRTFPVSEKMSNQLLRLPMYYSIKDGEQDQVIQAVLSAK
jgi:dTDP-4-amino-4,6-dideoxygalactose transaminase